MQGCPAGCSQLISNYWYKMLRNDFSHDMELLGNEDKIVPIIKSEKPKKEIVYPKIIY
jgi:hypothetical protein